MNRDSLERVLRQLDENIMVLLFYFKSKSFQICCSDFLGFNLDSNEIDPLRVELFIRLTAGSHQAATPLALRS